MVMAMMTKVLTIAVKEENAILSCPAKVALKRSFHRKRTPRAANHGSNTTGMGEGQRKCPLGQSRGPPPLAPDLGSVPIVLPGLSPNRRGRTRETDQK